MNPSKTLLLVEDNDSYRQIVRLSLSQRLPEYTIVEAASVQESLSAAPVEELDVAVLDMTLPDGMATDIIEAWKAPMENGLTVVVFSSYEPEEVAPSLLRMGVSAYVNKERGIKPLVQAIQTAVEGASQVGVAS